MLRHQQHIILASASPRRQALLDQIGVDYVVAPVHLDESRRVDESPSTYVQRMAAEKSLAAQQTGGEERIILAADTCVVLNEAVMGKPQSRAHALEMLGRLSGNAHQVLSAVSVRHKGHLTALSTTIVKFREITEVERGAYWASGESIDKAGGYAIQGLGALFVERIEGSFSGVVGLPLFETADLLIKAGVKLALN